MGLLFNTGPSFNRFNLWQFSTLDMYFSADLGKCISGALDVLDSIIKKVYDFFSFPVRLIIPGGSSEGTDNNQQIQKISHFTASSITIQCLFRVCPEKISRF